MNRVTPREASAQLNRLIAVFPRHGMTDEGVLEYAETMADFFAGEWHMRAVIDTAKIEFRYFPSLAELRELTDRVSARRSVSIGCANCIRSIPGMAYTPALWTPGSDGRAGRIEPLTEESAESIRPQIAAAIAHAKSQGRDYNGQRVIEKTDPCAAVGYCTCQVGVMLREARLARQAEAADKRAARGGTARAR